MKHYYINLKNRPERNQNMIDLFAKLEITDYERIEAVDGNLVDYNKVLGTKHKIHKPFSKDIEDEVRDLSDMADIQFTPDFDPENK